ncbi:hypothetical protein NPIL_6701 [Nephila pilipes]|uniref:Uncharacterized protein n=1 Tax=Nephila pilipes TaxID=299642 RepID=A0A8X6Q4N3_NEPPI|nr:hypothetical protein NPIL_6701 [Nephila pilipes]
MYSRNALTRNVKYIENGPPSGRMVIFLNKMGCGGGPTHKFCQVKTEDGTELPPTSQKFHEETLSLMGWQPHRNSELGFGSLAQGSDT